MDPGRGGSGPFAFENPDFNLKSLRLNTVLRWEWRPGSDLGRDLDELFASPSTNVFEVKATFRMGD